MRDCTTRLKIGSWRGEPPGPGELAINRRTGELFRVAAVGPGWVDVIRIGYEPPRLWPSALAATLTWAVFVFAPPHDVVTTVALFWLEVASAWTFARRAWRRWR